MECFVDDRDGPRARARTTTDGEHCATKLLWTRVQGGVIRSLQRTTLAELVEFGHGPARVGPTSAGAPTSP